MNSLEQIDTSTARLPSTYHAAKKAISQCASMDECKDWSDKAAALASYARQAQDEQLEHMAKRIRARATRRAGELLKQIEPAQGVRTDLGSAPSLSRKAAAIEAGLSERQSKTAQRLASVPEEDFEDMVESGATITEIAAVGTQSAPKNSDEAKHLIAAVKAYDDRMNALNIPEALAALTAHQRAEVRAIIARLDMHHDRIVTGMY